MEREGNTQEQTTLNLVVVVEILPERRRDSTRSSYVFTIIERAEGAERERETFVSAALPRRGLATW